MWVLERSFHNPKEWFGIRSFRTEEEANVCLAKYTFIYGPWYRVMEAVEDGTWVVKEE